jgi:hypothetical protein
LVDFMAVPLAGALVAFAFGLAFTAEVFCMSGFLVAFGAGLVDFMELAALVALGAGLVDFIVVPWAALVAFGAGLAAVEANAGTVMRNAAAIIDAIVFFKIYTSLRSNSKDLVGRERPYAIRATSFTT